MKKFLLNSADSLFKETRDLNFRVLGPLLHRKAEYIKETYKERHTAQTVNEMHSFMQKFKTAHAEHTLLQTHINLAEKISLVLKNKLFDQRLEVEKQMREGQESDLCEEYVETAIYKQEPILQVLRLLCLLSLTHGIKPKKFEFFKHEFLQTYGYEHHFTLTNLEKVGLFVPNTGKRNYSAIRKAFRLINPTVDLNNPNDISYLFNGYAPLLIRLVEAANKVCLWSNDRRICDLSDSLSVDLSSMSSTQCGSIGLFILSFSMCAVCVCIRLSVCLLLSSLV